MANTRHGHHVNGTAFEKWTDPIARCGGPRLCTDCALDAASALGKDEIPPKEFVPYEGHTEAAVSESLNDQIDRLAKFIEDEVPGEPSESAGAVDTAIRIIRELMKYDVRQYFNHDHTSYIIPPPTETVPMDEDRWDQELRKRSLEFVNSGHFNVRDSHHAMGIAETFFWYMKTGARS